VFPNVLSGWSWRADVTIRDCQRRFLARSTRAIPGLPIAYTSGNSFAVLIGICLDMTIGGTGTIAAHHRNPRPCG
jgi:hypothetical protein